MRVFIIAALSVDGQIGASAEHSSLDWRSKEDGRSFGELTRVAGVMVLGSTTYKTFRMKRSPPGRRLIVYSHHPETIVGEGVESTCEDPRVLVERLAKEGYSGLAVCGGASINSLFLNAGLVGELYLTIEPVVFGSGIPLLKNATHCQLQLLECTHLNDNTLLLHYAVLG